MVYLSIERKYIRFINENKDDELRMLNISDYERLSIRAQWWYNCHLIEGSSWYIGCDGSEVSFSSNLFTIQREASHNFPYFLKVIKNLHLIIINLFYLPSISVLFPLLPALAQVM